MMLSVCRWALSVHRPWEEKMLISPKKSLFFVATALMCAAALYAAEAASPSYDPLTRIFVGEPIKLTLPPAPTQWN
jgi:hypothetical protein